MGTRALVLALAMLAGSIVLPTHHAWAQTPDPETLVHEGVALRRNGRDDQALERFRQAYEIGHRINALGQLGFAEQALGQWVAADRDVREALSHGDDPWVRRNHELLEQASVEIQRHVGQLDVRGEPPGATVLVNGQTVGTLPLATPIVLEAGGITLSVREDGFFSVERSVTVNPSQIARESVSLRRRDSTQEAAPQGLGASAMPSQGRHRGVEPLAVALIAGGAALGIAGAVVGFVPVQRLSYGGDFGQYLAGVVGEYVCFAVGAAAIAAGLWWQFGRNERHGREAATSRPTIGLAPTPGGAISTFGWRFQ